MTVTSCSFSLNVELLSCNLQTWRYCIRVCQLPYFRVGIRTLKKKNAGESLFAENLANLVFWAPTKAKNLLLWHYLVETWYCGLINWDFLALECTPCTVVPRKGKCCSRVQHFTLFWFVKCSVNKVALSSLMRSYFSVVVCKCQKVSLFTWRGIWQFSNC